MIKFCNYRFLIERPILSNLPFATGGFYLEGGGYEVDFLLSS
jgi:hypothetical protein